MQLAGKTKSLATNLCDPQEFLGGNKSLPVNPCGLVAWSFFNDTYTVRRHMSASPARGVGSWGQLGRQAS